MLTFTQKNPFFTAKLPRQLPRIVTPGALAARRFLFFLVRADLHLRQARNARQQAEHAGERRRAGYHHPIDLSHRGGSAHRRHSSLRNGLHRTHRSGL